METKRINCYKCAYFHVTWDKRFPKGCKAYGFKTHYLPSIMVYHSSGLRCLKFTPKEMNKEKSP